MLTGWLLKGAQDPRIIYEKHKNVIKGILGQKEESIQHNKHWQVYVEFKKRSYATAVKAIFPSGAWHNEVAKGTAQDSRRYCSKQKTKIGKYFEVGTFSQQGKSDILTEIETLILDGATERDLWVAHFPTMVRHQIGVRRGMQMLNRQDDIAIFEQDKFPWTSQHTLDWTKTIILWGESGIGKTQWALSQFKKPLFVRDIDGLGMLDRSHDGIIFDDFDLMGSEDGKGRWPRHKQIHLLDQDNTSDIRIRYKIASIPAHTKKIFTTNVNGGAIVDLTDPAIERRVQVLELLKFTFEK